jgi:hypothetical protein
LCWNRGSCACPQPADMGKDVGIVGVFSAWWESFEKCLELLDNTAVVNACTMDLGSWVCFLGCEHYAVHHRCFEGLPEIPEVPLDIFDGNKETTNPLEPEAQMPEADEHYSCSELFDQYLTAQVLLDRGGKGQLGASREATQTGQQRKPSWFVKC